jgi:hypothetical protein
MGHDPLDVQLNWKLSRGEIHFFHLKFHLLTLYGLTHEFLGLVFAFGPLWLFLPKLPLLRKHKLLYFSLSFFLLILLAQLLLTSSIPRILAPALPLFLLLPIIYFESGQQETI